MYELSSNLHKMNPPARIQIYATGKIKTQRHNIQFDVALPRRPVASLPDLQAAWLLLNHCAAPRANYYLRALPPGVTAEFARCHDLALWSCLCGRR